MGLNKEQQIAALRRGLNSPWITEFGKSELLKEIDRIKGLIYWLL